MSEDNKLNAHHVFGVHPYDEINRENGFEFVLSSILTTYLRSAKFKYLKTGKCVVVLKFCDTQNVFRHLSELVDNTGFREKSVDFKLVQYAPSTNFRYNPTQLVRTWKVECVPPSCVMPGVFKYESHEIAVLQIMMEIERIGAVQES